MTMMMTNNTMMMMLMMVRMWGNGGNRAEAWKIYQYDAMIMIYQSKWFKKRLLAAAGMRVTVGR